MSFLAWLKPLTIQNAILNRTRTRTFKLDYSRTLSSLDVTPIDQKKPAEVDLTKSLEVTIDDAKPFEEMPGPKGLPFLGNVFAYSFLGPHSFQTVEKNKLNYMNRYGAIYREQIGDRHFVNVFETNDIMKVLEKRGQNMCRGIGKCILPHEVPQKGSMLMTILDGRQMAETVEQIDVPIISHGAALRVLDYQNPVASDFVGYIDANCDPETFKMEDLQDHLLKYMTESLAVICFGKRLGLYEKRILENTELGIFFNSIQEITRISNLSAAVYPYGDFNILSDDKVLLHKKTIEDITAKYVERSMDQGECLATTMTGTCGMSKHATGLALANLFTTGIHPSTKAMEYLLINLTRNPDKQGILYKEINKTVGYTSQDVTHEILGDLKYLKATLKETFRMAPPVFPGNVCVLNEDFVLGCYKVPKGVPVILNSSILFMMEKNFPNASNFVPERWLQTMDSKRYMTSGLYIPFLIRPYGFGPRQCLGQRFAHVTIQVGVAKILQKFRLDSCISSDADVIAEVFSKPSRPVPIKFVPRSKMTVNY